MPTVAEIKSNYPGYASWNDEIAIKADFAITSGEGKGPSGGQPQTADQVTPYLNTYQQNLLNQGDDPALQALTSTFAPALAGGGYVPQSGYVGKTLKQIGGEGLSFRADLLAGQLGIREDQPLTAEQVLSLGKVNLSDPTSSETIAFNRIFQKQPAPSAIPAGLPEPISRIEEFNRLRVEMGVEDIESYLVDLKAQEEFLYAELRARTGAERGKPVPLGVITGRVTEIERQQNERLDLIRRLKQTAVDQLNVAYGTISMFINYMGLDYADAVNSFNDNFQRNVAIYGLITGAKAVQVEEARFRTQLQIEQQQYEQQLASANLQTMVNAITSGNVTYDSLPAEQKSLIRKLEAQAGLPAGFTSSLQLNPLDTVLFQSSNEGITQVGFMNADGTVRVESYGTRIKSGGGDDKMTEQDFRSAMVEDIRGYANLDKVMQFYTEFGFEPNEILNLYNTNSPFGAATETEDDLVKKYGITF